MTLRKALAVLVGIVSVPVYFCICALILFLFFPGLAQDDTLVWVFLFGGIAIVSFLGCLSILGGIVTYVLFVGWFVSPSDRIVGSDGA
jgi:hypothetical protein